MKPEKHFPTILGLILLAGGIIGGTVLTSGGLDFRSKASGDCKPISLQVSDITNNSLSISFLTTDDCISNLFIDNRTLAPSTAASKLHYFQVNNLKEKTAYQYYFINGGTTYNDPSYKIVTSARPTGSIPTANLAWGKVLNANNSPAVGSVLFLNIPGASLLSSLVTADGNWNISLADSFNDQKTNWFVPPSGLSEDIIVLAPDGTTTQVSGDTSINNPVPDIILGQNGLLPTAIPNIGSGVLPTQSANSLPDINLKVNNPADGETISTLKPDFFGAAPLNSNINIVVESPIVYSGQTIPDSTGTWHWSPPANLTPGEHTLTVTATNPQTGIVQTIQRKFIVLASDSNLSFSSTPSATTITPTIEPTAVPTLIPTSVRVVRPSTTSEMPATGGTTTTLFYLIFSPIFILFSYLLLRQK